METPRKKMIQPYLTRLSTSARHREMRLLHWPIQLVWLSHLRFHQVSPKMNSPFVRAYSEVLPAYNIRIEESVSFLDSFNVLMTGSPPLAALNRVGNVLGLVPYHLGSASRRHHSGGFRCCDVCRHQDEMCTLRQSLECQVL